MCVSTSKKLENWKSTLKIQFVLQGRDFFPSSWTHSLFSIYSDNLPNLLRSSDELRAWVLGLGGGGGGGSFFGTQELGITDTGRLVGPELQMFENCSFYFINQRFYFFRQSCNVFFFFIFEFITRVMSQKHNIIKLKMIYRINELIFPRSGRLEKLLMLLYTYISSDTGWGGGGMAPTPEPETNQVETQIWK